MIVKIGCSTFLGLPSNVAIWCNDHDLYCRKLLEFWWGCCSSSLCIVCRERHGLFAYLISIPIWFQNPRWWIVGVCAKTNCGYYTFFSPEDIGFLSAFRFGFFSSSFRKGKISKISNLMINFVLTNFREIVPAQCGQWSSDLAMTVNSEQFRLIIFVYETFIYIRSFKWSKHSV